MNIDMDDENEPEPADRRIDMAFSESFHRLKRTVLLFATALLLLELSDTEAAASLAIPLVAGATVPLSLARLLLIGATVYYVFGFALEALTVRRLNVGVFDHGARALAAALERHADRLDWLGRRRPNLPPLPADHPATIVSMAVRNIDESIIHFRHGGKMPDLDSLSASLERSREALDVLYSKVDQTQHAVSRLSKLIARERLWSFVIWEIGLTGLYVAAALAFATNTALVSAGWVVVRY